MGRETGISWTDSTWNPIRGCSRVSEGCRNCYAETIAKRFSGHGGAYEGLVRFGDPEVHRDYIAPGRAIGWNGKIKFVEEHLLDPLRWKPIKFECQACGTDHPPKDCEMGLSRPRRIFVNSMSDLYHENVTDEMRDKIYAVMALCPQHTFQVLTKRPGRMLAYLRMLEDDRDMQRWANAALDFDLGPFVADAVREWEWPLPNVQLGVSVEDQKTADKRIPLLLQTPAAMRFISAEPLLGSLDLTNVMDRHKSKALKINCVESKEANPAHSYLVETMGEDYPYARLDWVIVGGESGSGARPMDPDWARSLRDQCAAAGVPFFFKQWGEWLPSMQDGADIEGQPQELNCSDQHVRVGAKAAGCLLDGVEYHEFPGGAALERLTR